MKVFARGHKNYKIFFSLLLSDVVEKITTRRREGVGVVVENNEESRRTFKKNARDLLTTITHTEILVARCIFLIKSESVCD